MLPLRGPKHVTKERLAQLISRSGSYMDSSTIGFRPQWELWSALAGTKPPNQIIYPILRDTESWKWARAFKNHSYPKGLLPYPLKLFE